MCVSAAQRRHRHKAFFIATFRTFRSDVAVDEIPDHGAQRQQDISKSLALTELYCILRPVYILEFETPHIAPADPCIEDESDNGTVTFGQGTFFRQDVVFQLIPVCMSKSPVYLRTFSSFGKKCRTDRISSSCPFSA